ncbi:hypothetical protein ZIOFF_053001 [Zingiber officinale]|uniref:SUZ domain-containing protein n=1 Tax=Zingiber officinale TaxID=94328 RepID=A0A8J5FE67_ZINOF|nr:hypothetical protein ZIOFF_053001 [Zingiber officinale]
MESSVATCADDPAVDSAASATQEKEGLYGHVDPFLLEILENSRHRLADLVTVVLRMELDIQRFMQNPQEQQFEFQHLPTSYLRCAAHRVAQHYGLQTMAVDNPLDGSCSRVVARKMSNSNYPAVCLSEILAKVPNKDTTEQIKIAIRQRPKTASSGDGLDPGLKSEVRTVEERKEEYDKARARIFNGSNNSEVEGSLASSDGISLFLRRYDEYQRNDEEIEKNIYNDGASRVAVFRDKEKDRCDPDYDRSYSSYVRGLSLPQYFNLQACSVIQPSSLQRHGSISQFGDFSHLPRNQSHLSYHMPNPATVNPYAVGCNQNTEDVVYVQWHGPTTMYSSTYEHLDHAMFQVITGLRSISITWALKAPRTASGISSRQVKKNQETFCLNSEFRIRRDAVFDTLSG